MLKWAREQAHFSIDEVSSRIKLDIIDVEQGKLPLNYSELKKLADLYRKPLVVFFLPQPPIMKDVNASCRTIPSKVYNDLSSNIVKMIDNARVKQISLNELNNGKNINIYKFLLIKEYYDNPSKIRKMIGLTDEQQLKIKKDSDFFSHLRDLLFEIGIYVFKDSFNDEEVSGFCIYDDQFPVIMINNNNTFTRQVFTLFHELHHLLKGISGIDFLNDERLNYTTNKSNYEEEVLSNKFAAEVLMPKSKVNELFNHQEDINEFDISRVASKFKISREVLTIQLYTLNLLSSVEASTLLSKFRQDHKRIKKDKDGGSYYSNQISYLGDKYINLAFSKYYKGDITSKNLTSYLGMNLKSTRTLAEFKGWGSI